MDDPTSICRELAIAILGDIDRGRATRAIDAFTPDAVFEVRGESLRGRDAILAFLTEREARRDRCTVHQITNETVLGETDGSLSISALVLLFVRRAGGGYDLDRVLDTVHHFRCTPQGWRVSARTSRPLHAAST